MKTLILILFLSIVAFSQTFVAGEVGTSVNAGLTRPTFGIVAGKQTERFNSEVSIFSLCKKDGGCGYEYSFRNTVTLYRHKVPYESNLLDRFKVGVVYSHYKVEKYSKSAVFLLGGVRFSDLELNYLHDLTSPNKIRSAEVRFTHYGKNHIFFRVTGNVGRFKQVNRSLWLIENSNAVGYWW